MLKMFKKTSSPSSRLPTDYVDSSEEIVLVQDRFQQIDSKRKLDKAEDFGLSQGDQPFRKTKQKQQETLLPVQESLASKLIQAARLGSFEEMKKLLSENSSIVNSVHCNWTALLYCAFYGRTEMIDYLLKAGANVNQASSNGTTPLMCSVERNHPSSVERLLKEGKIQVDQCDKCGETALLKAIKLGSLALVELLVEVGNADINFQPPKEALTFLGKGNAILHEAVLRGSEDIVRYLLENGAQVNLISNGFSPLHKAVSKNQPSIVKCLLDWEADVNQLEMATQRTPLHVACFYGFPNVVKVLLENGATGCLRVKDKHKKTPRAIATQKQHQSVLTVLDEFKSEELPAEEEEENEPFVSSPEISQVNSTASSSPTTHPSSPLPTFTTQPTIDPRSLLPTIKSAAQTLKLKESSVCEEIESELYN